MNGPMITPELHAHYADGLAKVMPAWIDAAARDRIVSLLAYEAGNRPDIFNLGLQTVCLCTVSMVRVDMPAMWTGPADLPQALAYIEAAVDCVLHKMPAEMPHKQRLQAIGACLGVLDLGEAHHV